MLFGFLVNDSAAFAAGKRTTEGDSGAALLKMGSGVTNGWQVTAQGVAGVGNVRSTAPVKASPLPESPTSESGSSSSASDFAQWWKVYPRKDAKLGAEKAYMRARKQATAAELLAGAEAYRQLKQGTDPAYIALPTTWLNQGRWMDASLRKTGAISPTRTEWVCRHEPRCGNRQTCALVSSKQCGHEPSCGSRESCLMKYLE